MAQKEELVKIVGPKNVLDDQETLEDYSKDHSFVPPRKPSCVVKPKSSDEVQKIVKWANKKNTPLIPVSSGPPRLRGDTVPVLGGVVVDLSGMNEIKLVDRPDRVAMIEPGVRYGELQEALRKESLRLPMPLCPRSSKSVIGSCLEREPHIIPKYHLDISEPLLCTEVVFGSGDLFRTGEAAGPGTIQEQWEAGRRQKQYAGVQTAIFRLIQGSQGTMGIVTWATLRCEVLPKVQRPFLVSSEKLDNLLAFAYRLVRLRLGDELFLINNHNLACILGDNPADIDSLRETLPRWILFFCIAGYEMFPEDRVEYQARDMTDIAKTIGVSPSPEAVPGVGAKELLEITKRPSKEPYWKLRYRGGCQEMFFISSFHGIPEFIDTVYEVVGRSQYSTPLGIYIQPINQGHGYHCEFDLAYDPANPTQSNQVGELYISASEVLMNRGAFFSRPYGPLADVVYNRDGMTKEALKKVKGIFDPNHVMNPGKICF